MLNCGIIGLPLAGKTTVFNVITKAGAEVKSYAGGKTDPNKALVSVPDPRHDKLVELYKPKKATPASMEFVDLAGLSRGAGKGEGLGNAFLSFVAEADALVHVLRTFDNPEVPHPEESVDPVRDLEIVDMELIFRDLEVIENRLDRLKAKKKKEADERFEEELLQRCREHLEQELPLRDLGLSPEEGKALRGFTFLTQKPQLVVCNLDESQLTEADIPGYGELKKRAEKSGFRLVSVYGRTEMEMAELEPEEQREFMEELGIADPGRERLIAEAYDLLGLISFFTTGKDEVKAWTIRKGDTAVDAAGAIHSDLARGFIRAQAVHYDEFIAHGASTAKCREAGVLRLEGKEYPVVDGDIIEIRFNV